ncbi:MAG: hypothetical protein IT504_09455 [Burkholderiaceae bacterium]|nr:hypothetical protein [Burkholderiaceae bacterium]
MHQHEVEHCESLSVSGVRNTATSAMRSMVRGAGGSKRCDVSEASEHGRHQD